MKKLLLTFMTGFLFFSCNSTDTKEEDPSSEIPPVEDSVSMAQDLPEPPIQSVVTDSREIDAAIKPPKKLVDFIEKIRVAQPSEYGIILVNNVWFPRHVIMSARRAKIISVSEMVDSVIYYFGSVETEVVNPKTGESQNAKITDEIVAFIYTSGSKIPIGNIVHSNHVVFPTIRKELQKIGRVRSNFTIAKSRGLNYYVDYPTSLMLAKYHSIPIYLGKIEDSIPVSVDSVSMINTDKFQVTIGVNPGDYFDLERMVYVPKID